MVGLVFFSLKASFFFFCKHRVGVIYQKTLILFHLSKAHSPRRTLVCQHAFWQSPVCFFCVSLLEVGLPGSSTMEPIFIQTETDGVTWNCCSLNLKISFDLYWHFPWLFLDRAILLFNLGPIFYLRPHPEMLATVPWALNFLIILATVVTGTSSSLEMVL